jgi:Zn-dependent protease
MSQDQLALLPLWYAVFLLSLTCHEAAHAWVAYRGGDATAHFGGQVTLNPLPHIRREPFGTVLVPLISYFATGWMMGWASAPYDPLWSERHPRRAAMMAAAGPFANLLLAAVALLALRAGIAGGLWVPAADAFAADRHVVALGGEGAVDGLGRFCSLLLFLNCLLFLFNLIPLPPLDGAAVVSGLSPTARRALAALRESGVGGLLGLLVAMYVVRWLFAPVYGAVLRLLFWSG